MWPVCAEGLLLYTQQQLCLLLPCEYLELRQVTSERGIEYRSNRPQALQRLHTGWGKVTMLSKDLLAVSGPGIESMKQTAFELSKQGPGGTGP